MSLLKIFRHEDFFPEMESKDFNEPWLRLATKGIVLDTDNLMALVSQRNEFYLLPGGGVEEGETAEQAFKRECLEEIGCEIQIDHLLGTTEEYRNAENRIQTVTAFLSKVVGDKGVPLFNKEDLEMETKVWWMTPTKALQILEGQRAAAANKTLNNYYNRMFNTARDIFIIELFLK